MNWDRTRGTRAVEIATTAALSAMRSAATTTKTQSAYRRINLATTSRVSSWTTADIAVSSPMAMRLYPAPTASKGSANEDRPSAIEKVTVEATAQTVSRLMREH